MKIGTVLIAAAMAGLSGRQASPPLALPLDATDPNFPRLARLWADQMDYEIKEVVKATRKTIATSQALVADIDRLLALR